MYFHQVNLNSFLIDEYKKIIKIAISDTNPDLSDIKSTQHGFQYNLFNKKNLEIINPIILNVSNQICSTLNIFNLNISSAWTVLGEKGTYHTLHRHNLNDDISTVLYLEVPNIKFPDADGCFYFFNGEEVQEIIPKKGDLLIFPATLFHGSYPQGEGLRQTLNLDFSRN
jgi:hypothetical protein